MLNDFIYLRLNEQINKPAAFTVDFNGAVGKLDARVVAPSGAEDEAIVQEVDKDKYAVRFIPRENGLHYIHVRLNGNHIPGSPFRVMVGKMDADAGMVRAYGDGLSRGQTGQWLSLYFSSFNLIMILINRPVVQVHREHHERWFGSPGRDHRWS